MIDSKRSGNNSSRSKVRGINLVWNGWVDGPAAYMIEPGIITLRTSLNGRRVRRFLAMETQAREQLETVPSLAFIYEPNSR
jgi:hypothetical protein